jgi:hypothetical protein
MHDGGAILDPAAAPPGCCARHGRLLSLLCLLLGASGLVLSAFPQLYATSGCPRAVVRTRAWLARRLSGGAWAPLPPPLPPLAPGECLPSGSFPVPRAPLGVDAASGLPIWGAAELAEYGSCAVGRTARDLPGCRVLLGVAGWVYDVTEKGSVHYAPGSGYCLFAGRDATRSLALGSLSQEDLEKGGWVADIQDGSVADQAQFYREKYGPPIGALPPPAPPPPPPGPPKQREEV